MTDNNNVTTPPLIPLPDPELLDNKEIGFLELIECRQSRTDYTNQPLTLKELSFLLWCTQGIKEVYGTCTKRNVPSFKALHPLETLLYLDKVDTLAKGFYQFDAYQHGLRPLITSDKVAKIVSGTGAGVVLLWVAKLKYFATGIAANSKTIAKEATSSGSLRNGQANSTLDSEHEPTASGEHDFSTAAGSISSGQANTVDIKQTTSNHNSSALTEYILYLEAGHICQNLYLATEVLGLGVTATLDFDLDALQRELGLNMEEYRFIYAATVGKV